MQHQHKIKELFTIKEWITNGGFSVLFLVLGIYYLFVLPNYGFMFIGFSFIIFFLFVFLRVNKLFMKVYRIKIQETELGSKPRLLIEYWLKEEVLELDKEFFWLERNKYTPVICDINGEFKPVYPFVKGKSTITSGQLYRSLVQKATDMLMKPEKSDILKAIETGALLILTGGGALLIISLVSNIIAPEIPVNVAP